LLLASGCWIARAAFYALIEANVAWGAERYLRCVSPVFILVLFLAAMLAGGILRFSRGKR
jgi:hypothetical protein